VVTSASSHARTSSRSARYARRSAKPSLAARGGEPLVGGVAALTGQPLSTWAQPDPNLAQGPLDRPLVHVELGGELWDAVAGVAAGLQVVAQVGEAKALGASLQVAGAAVVDTNPPRMTSCRGVFAGEGSTHPFVVPGLTAIGKPRMSAAGVGGPALRLEAGFFIEP
jgi:hypothetical protein